MSNAAAVPAILSGIRVLDMSRVLAGPWSAQLLADFGAEVIKIERPNVGDDSRTWQPSFESTLQPGVKQTAYFCSANRGKKSVTIDFSQPEGAELVRELVKTADVLVENYVVGTLARYGLDFEALQKINPRLIFCSVTGFGQTGPYAARGGYDYIAQAYGGLMSITGQPDVLPDGRPGSGPLRVGMPIMDVMTGVYAALSIMGALRHRDLTGKGQHIDLALLDVTVFTLSYTALSYLASGKVPLRVGNGSPIVAPSNSFPTADGWVALMVGTDAQFLRFCTALGHPEWAQDARFPTSLLRVQNVVALEALVMEVLATNTSAHWVALLEEAGVPCGQINDMAGVFTDPQVAERGGLQKVTHPVMGELPVLANPMHMSAAPVKYDIPPPMLGEHTEEVLTALLGKTGEQIRQLRARKVL